MAALSIVSTSCLSPLKSVAEDEAAREKFECLWKGYLGWRRGCGQRDAQAPPKPIEATLDSPSRGTTFSVLFEIQAAARDALSQQCSPTIPLDFVMALMEAAADTTTRYMSANPAAAARYSNIAFQLFWRGLSAIGDPEHEAG